MPQSKIPVFFFLSTIAQNLGYQAVMQGHTVLFTTAANMLNDLAALDSANALRRRIKHYAKPALLIIDEVGYLSYSDRHADLLFEIINQRYEHHSTLVTTNRPFAEWNEVFPKEALWKGYGEDIVQMHKTIQDEQQAGDEEEMILDDEIPF